VDCADEEIFTILLITHGKIDSAVVYLRATKDKQKKKNYQICIVVLINL
jgi:t-SNARE complex subunit (syntaxin)